MTSRRQALKIAAAGVAFAMWPWPARAALSTAVEQSLKQADVIYIATRRKDGSLSTIKPVWFYYQGDGKLFFTTSPDSWKAKRIKAGSPLYIWVGAEDGHFVEGRAEPTTDQALIDKMGAAYSQKYWIAWLGFFKPRSDRVTDGKTLAYEVTLEEKEPPAKKTT